MRFLQLFAVFIFLALIGNLLKPLYWDRAEDLLMRPSDFGAGAGGLEDTTGLPHTAEGYVTRSGLERFRLEVRERYARLSDVERLRRDLRENYATGEALNELAVWSRSALDSLSQTLQTAYLPEAQIDSLVKGLVKEERFVALQGFVQGLHRARRGGGMVPMPAGRPLFRRRNLWTGYHQTHPPYVTKTGGGR